MKDTYAINNVLAMISTQLIEMRKDRETARLLCDRLQQRINDLNHLFNVVDRLHNSNAGQDGIDLAAIANCPPEPLPRQGR